MTKRFDKDGWIRDALAAKYLICERDGTIWRRKWASSDGTRMSSDVERVKPRIHKKSGRVYFNMTWKGITKSVLVNRVIGWAFHPNPDNLPQVNHKDGDKEHNAADNLEWSTGRDNEVHAHRNGLKTGRGSQNSNAKLTANDVIWIRENAQMSDVACAEEFGVARSTIVNIRKGNTWKHL